MAKGTAPRWAALVRTALVSQPCWPWVLKEINKLKERCVEEQPELNVWLRKSLYTAELSVYRHHVVQEQDELQPEIYQ